MARDVDLDDQQRDRDRADAVAASLAPGGLARHAGILAVATDGLPFRLATRRASRRQPERRLRPRRLRLPRNDDRDDAADTALPALRAALLLRRADSDGRLRSVRLRRHRRPARVRERLRRDRAEAGAPARAGL